MVVVTSQKSVTVRIGEDMSRDYIFRGFHPDENGSKTITLNGKKIKGEWVEGNLFIAEEKEYYEIVEGNKIVRIHHNVIPETVGLWTGHTDASKTKIFDGDRVILNDNFDEVYTGEWDNDIACFVIEGNGVSYVFDNVRDDEIEVIGNKWEVEG